jgi:hypothetical protein
MHPLYFRFLQKDPIDPYAYYDDYGNRFLILDQRELSLINKNIFISLFTKNR